MEFDIESIKKKLSLRGARRSKRKLSFGGDIWRILGFHDYPRVNQLGIAVYGIFTKIK